jgi:hypothetical protein
MKISPKILTYTQPRFSLELKFSVDLKTFFPFSPKNAEKGRKIHSSNLTQKLTLVQRKNKLNLNINS